MSASGNFPLSAHLDFRVKALDDLAEAVHARLSAKVVHVGRDNASIDARGNRFNLPSSVLWSCSYGVPLRLKFPEGRDLRVQFHRRGIGGTQAGDQLIAVNERQACIYAGEAVVDFGRDFAQFAWRVPLEVLERKLSALTGRVVSRRLAFNPVLDLTTPESRTLLRLLEAVLNVSEAGTTATAKLIQSELENSLLVALLCSAQHNLRDWLGRESARPAPWQVRRAETFIEANWNNPITLEAIVEASGASARSVFRGFKEYRGYTPLQFLRHVRLQEARRLLQDPETGLNVTQVAMACGFSDTSRFSKDFAHAFGLSPSSLRRAGHSS